MPAAFCAGRHQPPARIRKFKQHRRDLRRSDAHEGSATVNGAGGRKTERRRVRRGERPGRSIKSRTGRRRRDQGTRASDAFRKRDNQIRGLRGKIRNYGGVVEERVGIGAAEVRSPSVQLRVTPLGNVELLSTHDQMLGGPSGQSYLGCIFPADPGYASAITRDAAKVGALLRDAGVIGRFALDFVVTRASKTAAWETYAIEINLRKGGTTHPFLTLQFLTGGSYDAESATFTAPNGKRKFLIASDHMESPLYRGYTPDDLFDLVVRRGLHFGQTQQTGIVFHMLSALGSRGRLGLTAVGNSPEEAREIYDHAESVLNEEARFDEISLR